MDDVAAQTDAASVLLETFIEEEGDPPQSALNSTAFDRRKKTDNLIITSCHTFILSIFMVFIAFMHHHCMLLIKWAGCGSYTIKQSSSDGELILF
jgi:hypothetical protein